MAEDPIAEFKARQREVWALGNFGDMAVFTTPVAGHLVRYSGVRAGQTVLDVGCGTGVVAITAARLGARVAGLDLTPSLLEQARTNAQLAGVAVEWKEGDAESLPFPDAAFDAVLSQFGHMFAPRPDVTTQELLRVLKPGGRVAFATWPPEQLIGRSFVLNSRYVTPPAGVTPPIQWGDVGLVQQRLGSAAKAVEFERGTMGVPALSPEHYMGFQQAKTGPFIRTLQALQKDPAKLEAYTKEYLELVASYMVDNVVRHEYLLTRAIKA